MIYMIKRTFICLLFCLACSVSYSQWTNIRIENQISPKNDIRSICFDNSGTLFVGTANGVYEQKDKEWHAASPEDVYVESFNIDRKNVKRAGIWGGGVYKSNPNKSWEKDEKASISMSANVINNDIDDNIWIGTWNKGLIKIDAKGKIMLYNADNSLLGDNSVLSVATDVDKTLWVGTYHGLSNLREGRWKTYNRDNSGLPNNDIYSLAVDNANKLWIGSCGGLVCFDGKEWTIYNIDNSDIQSNIILSLAVDSNNIIWIGTPDGLAAKKGEMFYVFNTRNSNIINNRIQTMHIKDGRLYLGTASGLSMIDLAELNF